MKKAFRFVVAVTLFAVLGISEAPAPATCQMAYGSFLAGGCRMPCCQTKLPMPKCPMLKTSAPRDFIASSVPVLDSALVPLHDAIQVTLPGLRPLSQVLTSLTAALQLLFAGPPLSIRAPPADVQLLDA